MTLEAEVKPGSDHRKIRDTIKATLEKRFAIGHTTVEIKEGE